MLPVACNQATKVLYESSALPPSLSRTRSKNAIFTKNQAFSFYYLSLFVFQESLLRTVYGGVLVAPQITPSGENYLRRVYFTDFSIFFDYCYSFGFLMLFYIVCMTDCVVDVL